LMSAQVYRKKYQNCFKQIESLLDEVRENR
jgi:hypothetical protein